MFFLIWLLKGKWMNKLLLIHLNFDDNTFFFSSVCWLSVIDFIKKQKFHDLFDSLKTPVYVTWVETLITKNQTSDRWRLLPMVFSLKEHIWWWRWSIDKKLIERTFQSFQFWFLWNRAVSEHIFYESHFLLLLLEKNQIDSLIFGFLNLSHR